jgi:hypothetical protein
MPYGWHSTTRLVGQTGGNYLQDSYKQLHSFSGIRFVSHIVLTYNEHIQTIVQSFNSDDVKHNRDSSEMKLTRWMP